MAPQTTVLTVLRSDHPTHSFRPELAGIERHRDRVAITLDDGTMLSFDAQELAAATASGGPTIRIELTRAA